MQLQFLCSLNSIFAIKIDENIKNYFKMILNLELISLTFLLVIFGPTFGYKCEFEDSEFVGYICGLKPELSNDGEQHVPGKSDDDVKRVEFNGYWNQITTLTQSAVPICERFKNLEIIDVRKMKIDGNFLRKCGNLKKIYIIDSEFSGVTESFLADSPKLNTIMMRGNKMTNLPENIFINQKQLVELNLSGNQINFLPPNIFKTLTSLRSLDLSNNKLQPLNKNWFKNLPNLRVLSLVSNGIADLPKSIFNSLSSIEQIYLESNKLTTIHSDSFGTKSKLTIINLYDNKVNAVDERLIDNTAVDVLNMSNNVCSKDNIQDRVGIKVKLKMCFDNYRPRM
ncbi:hypothetical protein ACKWTF_015034 [Chironomus riparius]